MYKRKEQGWFKHLDFILLDALCGQLALFLAHGWRHGFRPGLYGIEIYRNLAIWMGLFSVVIAILFNTMHDVLKRRWTTELRQTLTQCLLVFGTVVIYLFSVKGSEQYSRITLWLSLGLYAVLAFVTRMLWKQLLRRRLRRSKSRAVLLVADEASAGDIMARFKAHSLENIGLSGIVLVDRDAAGELIDGVPVVANLCDAAQYIWTMHLQMAPTGLGKQVVETVAGMPVITSSINIATPLQLLIKRIMDIFGGLVLSIAALVTIVIVGPIIKIKSPGPILYKQERIGQNGRKFKMYKIRSMYMDADARKQELMSQNRVSDGMMFKLDFDPRIIGNEIMPDGTKKTGIGEFIRKTSIDELPQGFNILLGQMSLVGTRPPTVDEWEKYEFHHRARLATKPGLTGMWQVSGRSDITNFEDVTRLDTEYIENWSLGLDVKILLKTVGVVLGHRGAM